ncbi:flagellar hook-basal body complex protein [Shimia sp.]|uniref:flagellar hook-basal body complex protein n=1 Tax=Shimia sp. TaxID=1954381 RepID=UPI003296B9CD
MDNATYTTLTRQAGLGREMSVIANNIANASTSGFRQAGVTFTEFIQTSRGSDSLSMAVANLPSISAAQGTLTQTGGTFDFAIEGDGFFMVETPNGDRLTRAGSFAPNGDGDLVTPDGYRVMDSGGTPIFIPPDADGVDASSDGTISIDGRPLAQIGVFEPLEPLKLKRVGAVMFDAPGGADPLESGRVVQGFIENSNVDTISQLSRMIEVQRSYEMGQGFLDSENERIRTALKTFIR